MKVKIGEYVRTDRGIAKIKKINNFVVDNKKTFCIEVDNLIGLDAGGNEFDVIPKDHINKTSLNIIDLIEIGDYVNGSCVHYISHDRKHFMIECEEGYIKAHKFEKYIETIVTKEQFEEMQYKIER